VTEQFNKQHETSVAQHIAICSNNIRSDIAYLRHWRKSVIGPTVCISLPNDLHNPAVDSEDFSRDLKTHLFTGHYGTLAHYICSRNRALLINICLLSCLLTWKVYRDDTSTHTRLL